MAGCRGGSRKKAQEEVEVEMEEEAEVEGRIEAVRNEKVARRNSIRAKHSILDNKAPHCLWRGVLHSLDTVTTETQEGLCRISR